MKTTSAILLLAFLLCGCGKSTQPAKTVSQYTNSLAEEINPLKKLAEQKFHDAVASDVVGLSRVIKYEFFATGGSVTNWKAEAIVEVFNHFGGIDRTNLPFCFSSYVSEVNGRTNIIAQIDGLEIYKRALREIDARPQ